MSVDERKENLGPQARRSPWMNARWIEWILLAGVCFFVYSSLTHADDERRRTARTTCHETNIRHVKTIEKLDVLFRPPGHHLTPSQQKDADQSASATRLIIDQLVPLRDGKMAKDFNPKNGKFILVKHETCAEYAERIIPK